MAKARKVAAAGAGELKGSICKAVSLKTHFSFCFTQEKLVSKHASSKELADGRTVRL